MQRKICSCSSKLKKFKFLFPTQLCTNGEHECDLPVYGTGEGDGWVLSFLLTMHCDREQPHCGFSLPSQSTSGSVVASLWILEWYQLSIHHFFISVLQHSNCNSLLLGLVRPSYTSGEIFVSFSAPNISQLHLDFLKDKQMKPIISRPALITQLVEPRFSLWNINKGSKKITHTVSASIITLSIMRVLFTHFFECICM